VERTIVELVVLSAEALVQLFDFYLILKVRAWIANQEDQKHPLRN